MKTKLFFILGMFGLFLSISFVSAMEVNFFYSPTCPACKSIIPTINSLIEQFKKPFYIWNINDVSQGNYNVQSVPTIKIKTSDCREIELVGTQEINKYLKCELQEQSTEECMTHHELKRGSYFIE